LATAVVIAVTVATVPDLAGSREPAAFVWLAVLGLFLVPYTTVGALIEDRRPGQVVGRICLTIGVLLGVGGLLLVASATLDLPSGLPPLGAALTFVGSMMLVVVTLLSEPLLVSRFPDGRESGRAGAVVDGLLAIAGAAVPPWLGIGLGLRIDILGVAPDDVATVLGAVIFLAGALGSILACVGLARRYARGSSIVRAQIRWFAAAIGTSIVLFVFMVLVFLTILLFPTTAFAVDHAWTVGAILALVWLLSLLLPPLAIGVAILRHRLYDIDRIVSRTIAYALVSAIVAIVFGGVIIVLSAALATFAQGQTIAVAGSTLAAFAVSQPVLRRVRRNVDRRFNRDRYDADRTVAAFSTRLRDEIDIATVTADLNATVQGAVNPASLGLWIRGGRP
jgi:MFS family permease